MLPFQELFDSWAADYDQTVYGHDGEYREVFTHYDQILEKICDCISDKKGGITLEIGMGTGNLSMRLAKRGHHVVGVEPSSEMRKIAAGKLRNVIILDGHFLDIPIRNAVDSIVTSYALHHLPYAEKVQAIHYLDGLLRPEGRVVVADTMFSSPEYKEQLLKDVAASGALNLLRDLNTEFYEYLEDITSIFVNLGYRYETFQMNRYVWVVSAQKGEE